MSVVNHHVREVAQIAKAYDIVTSSTIGTYGGDEQEFVRLTLAADKIPARIQRQLDARGLAIDAESVLVYGDPSKTTFIAVPG